MLNTDQIKFMKGIGLDSSSEDGDEEMKSQGADDDESTKWSNAYFSISCLENIFEKCD